MNRLIKIGLGLIVLLSLAAAAVPSFLSTDFVKSRIEEIRSGEVEPVSWSEVKADLNKVLGRD